MFTRMVPSGLGNAVWLYNQDALPQLLTMTLGTVPVFMSPAGVSGAPYGSILGRPALPMEQCATFGNVGDIIFFDPRQYIAIDKSGIQTASSIHVHFTMDETCFRWVYRYDGQPAYVSAITPAT